MTRFILFILALSLATSCSRVPEQECPSSAIVNRIHSRVEWYGNNPDSEVQSFIQCLIDRELTADSAIQISLLNNPKIQAFFEELGIAQANLVEAGLLTNPSFELNMRFPHKKGLTTNIEYLITTSLLDIFLIPLRTKLAATDFEQTKLKVSNEILNLAFEVRETFYQLVAENDKVKDIQLMEKIAHIQNDIASKQIAIGNINSLDYQLSHSKFLEVKLELLESEAEIIRLKEKLNRLLGLRNDGCLIFPDRLPEDFCDQEYDICALESIALTNRLDLQVARFEINRLCQMLGLKDWWTYTHLKGGVAGERDPDGTNLLGPGFSGEIPIFNYGQAARMRLIAQLRQAQDQYDVLEIQVLSEVREAHLLILTYSRILKDYQNDFLPLQENISTSSEELYNVMGLGLDKLLDHKKLFFMGRINFTESQKKYLVAKVKLDRALGGYLSQLLAQTECVQEVVME